MAYFEEHCEDCVKELGTPFENVHKWLDAFFNTMGPDHRKVRHHENGVEEVRKLWGDGAARAAEIHIEKDCHGKIPTKEQANNWSLFGPSGFNDGSTFLTDE